MRKELERSIEGFQITSGKSIDSRSQLLNLTVGSPLSKIVEMRSRRGGGGVLFSARRKTGEIGDRFASLMIGWGEPQKKKVGAIQARLAAKKSAVAHS